jgi:multimeric flavodoxin WrbA
MLVVSVVYSSRTGHLATQASSIAEGVRSVPGAECRLVDLSRQEVPWDVLASSAAIMFGSPACNGTVSAELKRFFEDSTPAALLGLRWRDKVAAGFTSSGAGIGDALDTLVTMALFAAQHGMLWVGLDLFPLPGDGRSPRSTHRSTGRSGWLGATARSHRHEGPAATPGESDLRTAAYLGHRVTKTALRMAR